MIKRTKRPAKKSNKRAPAEEPAPGRKSMADILRAFRENPPNKRSGGDGKEKACAPDIEAIRKQLQASIEQRKARPIWRRDEILAHINSGGAVFWPPARLARCTDPYQPGERALAKSRAGTFAVDITALRALAAEGAIERVDAFLWIWRKAPSGQAQAPQPPEPEVQPAQALWPIKEPAEDITRQALALRAALEKARENYRHAAEKTPHGKRAKAAAETLDARLSAYDRHMIAVQEAYGGMEFERVQDVVNAQFGELPEDHPEPTAGGTGNAPRFG